MSEEMRDYLRKLSRYLDVERPYRTLLGSDATDELSRFDYVVDLTNDYITEADFAPEELNDLMDQVSPGISADHTLTRVQLAEFIELVRNDTYKYEGETLNYIEN